jgi:hypothetical protein
MIFRPNKNDAGPKERALWADLMSMGLVFPIAIVIGFFLGRWVGGLVGHPEGGQWIGLIWGIAAGFWELYKVTLRMNAMDAPPPEEGPQEPKPGDDDGKP